MIRKTKNVQLQTAPEEEEESPSAWPSHSGSPQW